MKTQNEYEKLFEDFLDLTEFTLIKHKDGWGLYDRQGGNFGNIEGDRFKSAAEILDRMDIYVDDYIREDLENVWVDELDKNIDDAPSYLCDWLNYRVELREYQYELDLIDQIWENRLFFRYNR